MKDNKYNEFSFKNKDIDRIGVVQDTIKKTPQQLRAERELIAKAKRDVIIGKKEEILNRQAASKGMTREQQKEQQKKDAKKPNACLPGLNTDAARKRGESKGSCATGQTNKGESTKDNE